MSSIWAIADLHLALGIPEKTMEFFGEPWIGYTEKMEKNWREKIKPEDLVLIAGDISWAMKPEQALKDLLWIDNLPGTKVMIRGNHDYWWTSLAQIKKILPSSIHIIQNNVYHWHEFSIGGARMWDTPEYDFKQFVIYQENPRAKKLSDSLENMEENEKIFLRELGRLELSLQGFLEKPKNKRIVMTHYPPLGVEGKSSRISTLLEKYEVEVCVFGHLHSLGKDFPMCWEREKIKYFLTSSDFLDFNPIKIF